MNDFRENPALLDVPEPPEMPMFRPSLKTCMMEIAKVMAQRSTCTRLHVGAVVTDESTSNIIAIGYNGNYKGGPNVPDSNKPGETGYIHAEVNALIKADFQIKHKKMFVTHSPCIMCAKLIVNAQIEEVYIGEMYRDFEPLKLLLSCGVKVYKIDTNKNEIEALNGIQSDGTPLWFLVG